MSAGGTQGAKPGISGIRDIGPYGGPGAPPMDRPFGRNAHSVRGTRGGRSSTVSAGPWNR
ncbi:hypothetical protein FRACA_210029 [Frankia canadensis]|uniref:Uncharacterized protein n=1 Tax=Frankia canadensis TaxID=1836972 RepID=A0A2I2KQK1_9ACTN|nr:hypothetical protein FRACA_210029 [Frankia canadensis]SOU55234.1 hypothetical protein FRACA_210029 [Frankia canadensis]